MELVEQIGASVTNGFAYLGSLATLGGRAAYYTFVGPFQGRPLRLQRAVSQAMDVGVRALPILSLITFFIGLILALQGAYELRKFGALDLVATAVAISMTRELGPLITAIVVIGRSGSAFAAEIGTMKVTEEIDALETMAISPIHFLVTPKFLAMMVMLPCLTIWANTMGIMGGALFGVAQADFTWMRYVRASIDALFLRDITTGLIKSVMFGITITAVGCLEGLSTGAGAEQVGRSTTRAVVMSIFLVVVVDLIFTVMFFFVGGGG
jgi:phospholipid/cholesterol/gamma-HCH transport system permease protein